MKNIIEKISLRDALHSKVLNFNLVRLILSLLVIVGHSYDLFLDADSAGMDPVWAITKFTYAGHTAVLLFFFLSGLLVTASARKHKPIVFMVHRLSRIYPALLVNIFLQCSWVCFFR